MQLDKRDVYKRYFRWLETHISSQKSRFLGVNVNGTINANAPHTSLIYQISSSEVDWKALVNVRVELKELNSVFSQVWPTVRHSRKYFPVGFTALRDYISQRTGGASITARWMATVDEHLDVRLLLLLSSRFKKVDVGIRRSNLPKSRCSYH